MSYIKSGDDANGNPINIYYEDWGQGSPVVLIHGWPLDHQMWESQLMELPKHGNRVIAYDRRGFGRSSKPWEKYDYDTLADDLKAVLDGLDLQNVTLVGFSMGGGEVARYMNRHGGARVAKVAFISAVTPYLLKTDDNPTGVDKAVFDEMLLGIKKDRPAFLADFNKKFFGVGLISHPVSQPLLDWAQMITTMASPKATVDCAIAFAGTDFRQDLAAVKVPTLIVHGSSDQTVPIKASGDETAKRLPHATYLVYDGAPHGLFVTEKDRLNQDLLAFLSQGAAPGTPTTNGQSATRQPAH